MFRWYLITHNLHAFQTVTSRMQALGAEYFSPTKIEMKKRRDCNALRTKETPLFPGYIFVRLDPEQIHPATIADIPGVKEFVRFGAQICEVSNSIIEALKHSLLLRANKKVTNLECRNVNPGVLDELSKIALMKSKIERQTALFALLQKDTQLRSISTRSHSRLELVREKPAAYSRIDLALEKPAVNESLW